MPARFGCLEGIRTFNTTRGCLFRSTCGFFPAGRGFGIFTLTLTKYFYFLYNGE